MQPLMYGAPFYSMPFTYPPASSGAQMTTDQATGVATAVVERKDWWERRRGAAAARDAVAGRNGSTAAETQARRGRRSAVVPVRRRPRLAVDIFRLFLKA